MLFLWHTKMFNQFGRTESEMVFIDITLMFSRKKRVYDV
jgi:hypothetical protein